MLRHCSCIGAILVFTQNICIIYHRKLEEGVPVSYLSLHVTYYKIYGTCHIVMSKTSIGTPKDIFLYMDYMIHCFLNNPGKNLIELSIMADVTFFVKLKIKFFWLLLADDG